MPLARGTAACGYTFILSLFWAADMPVTVYIPKDYQVDWEAILEQHPSIFVNELSTWLIPSDVQSSMNLKKSKVYIKYLIILLIFKIGGSGGK